MRFIEPPTPEELRACHEAYSKEEKRPMVHALLPEYSDVFVPKQVTVNLPKLFEDLFDKNWVQKRLCEIKEHCRTILSSVTVTKEEVEKLESLTREQSRNSVSLKLWKKYRRYRITASIAGQVYHTSTENVSMALLATICCEKETDLSKVPAIK